MDILSCVPDHRMGGPQQRILDVAKKLRERDIETTFLLPATEETTFVERISQAGFNYKQTDIPRIRSPKMLRENFQFLFRWPTTVRHLGEIIEEAESDVIHVNGPVNFIPARAAEKSNARLVWHFNDMLTPPPLKQLAAKTASRWADEIVVSADAVHDYYFTDEVESTTIYPPVDISKFSDTNPGSIYSDLDVDPDTNLVGAVGNVNPAKGYEYLIDAAEKVVAKCPETVFVIAGKPLSSKEGYYEMLKRRVEEKNLTDSVRFIGYREDISSLLAALDLFVLSSVSEACPIVILEAMASRCPVVATEVGGVPEEIPNDKYGWLVEPQNSAKLAESIREALQSPKRREAAAENSYQRVTREFSLDTCASRHTEVYENSL